MNMSAIAHNDSVSPQQAPALAGQGMIAHLMVVTHFVMKQTLDQLMASNRYEKLSMTYERYIPVLLEGDIAPSELAVKAGTSKQACSKTVKELEKTGLIARRAHPDDGRSSLLSLSAKGIELLKEGTRITAGIQQQLAAGIGREHMDRLIVLLEKVCNRAGVELRAYPAVHRTTGDASKGRSTRLNMLLQALTTHLRESLLEDMKQKGFTGLRTNFGQILGMISRQPRRIQDIASMLGISKQAASVIAIEFESLGYVIRQADSLDKRQLVLRLSAEGERLVDESIASIRTQENNIQGLLGADAFRELESILAKLYSAVAQQLDNKAIAAPTAEKIQTLTTFLFEELGVDGVKALAQHLISITRGDT